MSDRARLEAIVEAAEGDNGGLALCSPAVGVYGGAPRVGEILVAGSRAGRLTILGRTADVVVPPGTTGRVAEVVPPLVSFVGRETALLGSMGYTLEELERVVGLAAGGELDLSRSISARYPLERALEAFDDLHHRRGDPVRLALVPKQG